MCFCCCDCCLWCLFDDSPEAVIKRFEEREHEVDSRGVVEYLRALVVTNAISEYLPDDGKTDAALPSLVFESFSCFLYTRLRCFRL